MMIPINLDILIRNCDLYHDYDTGSNVNVRPLLRHERGEESIGR